eukprot:5688158-Amphidinium_carterae.1
MQQRVWSGSGHGAFFPTREAWITVLNETMSGFTVMAAKYGGEEVAMRACSWASVSCLVGFGRLSTLWKNMALPLFQGLFEPTSTNKITDL